MEAELLQIIDRRSVPELYQLYDDIPKDIPEYHRPFLSILAQTDPYFALYTQFWQPAMNHVVRRYTSYPYSRERILEIVDDSMHVDDFLEALRWVDTKLYLGALEFIQERYTHRDSATVI